MKRVLNIAGGLVGLIVLLVLAVMLTRTFGGLQEGVELTSQTFQSPIRPTRENPTSSPTPGLPIPDIIPSPLPKSTLTVPPPPPTRTPTPTFTPAPPTATPEPLPTLIPGLDTLVYATTGENSTTGEKYPELYRVQVNEAGRTVGPVYRVEGVAGLPRSGGGEARTHIFDLHPSPDGQYIAVEWGRGTGMFISILDVHNGQFKPLFPEGRETALYLDWAPDGNHILVLRTHGSPAKEGAWLVDLRTHQYNLVDVKPRYYADETTSASFSPDGKQIVYARSNGWSSGSEIWRINLDGSERQLLYEVPDFKVEDVRWSPDGNYIAFTQSPRSIMSELPYGYAIGELWVMTADGQKKHLLNPALIGSAKRFVPVWSPNSQHLAFAVNSTDTFDKKMTYVPGNIYLADVASGSISKMTDFEAVEVQKPVWSSDGLRIAFVASLTDNLGTFEPMGITVDGHELHPLSENTGLVIRNDHTFPFLVWLPTSQRGER